MLLCCHPSTVCNEVVLMICLLLVWLRVSHFPAHPVPNSVSDAVSDSLPDAIPNSVSDAVSNSLSDAIPNAVSVISGEFCMLVFRRPFSVCNEVVVLMICVRLVRSRPTSPQSTPLSGPPCTQLRTRALTPCHTRRLIMSRNRLTTLLLAENLSQATFEKFEEMGCRTRRCRNEI